MEHLTLLALTNEPWGLGVWLVMFAVICQAGPEGRRKVLQARINRVGLI
jgi:hypothetical protein